ncbi:DUF599 family protein [Amaricoccus macauensis]|uniref:DUF599 family protein n=1 Tax=Amaricoccus macauensis TaxID=57001 RepID=UPI003C7A5098
MTIPDYLALAVFLACWLSLEPALRVIASKWPSVTGDMMIVRAAWMRQLLRRNFLLIDAQIIGQTIHSATFFGSANLLVIVGIGGAVVSASDMPGGGIALHGGALELHGWRAFLLLAPLLRGLFDFIWSVRQLNYFLAAMAASPLPDEEEQFDTWSPALAALLNRSLSSFSQGVRNYYFACAAALWLLGPLPLAAGALGATAFLIWRQTRSATADRIHELVPLLPLNRSAEKNKKVEDNEERTETSEDHSAARTSEAP